MSIWVGRDAAEFVARAGAFVEAEIDRNVLATVLAGVQGGRYEGAIFAVVEDLEGEPLAVALRTPPHGALLAGWIEDPDGFVSAWRREDPDLPGVLGAPVLVDAVAAAWRAATGQRTETRLREALHVLTRVVGPEPSVPGELVRADWRCAAQLAEWGMAFAVEAGLSHPVQVARGIQHSLNAGHLWVWTVGGGIGTMVGHRPAVAGSVRIGPVYTPPELRGRGYATAATAALSQCLLDDGAVRCLLYTDLANPISNHIYAKIGYERIADWIEIGFGPEPAGSWSAPGGG